MAFEQKEWYVPDMFWPADTSPGVYVSHEALCVLNHHNEDCQLDIVLYYEDAEPLRLPTQVCPARRTAHIRMDQIRTEEGAPIPRGIGYAAVIKCSLPVPVQYTRVDTTQAANSMMTTMAFPLS